jgi:hypothetical protein
VQARCERIQHFVAARALARLRECDARIDELLLQLVGAPDGFLLSALVRADAVADGATAPVARPVPSSLVNLFSPA